MSRCVCHPAHRCGRCEEPIVLSDESFDAFTKDDEPVSQEQIAFFADIQQALLDFEEAERSLFGSKPRHRDGHSVAVRRIARANKG